jgi:hypothetical protein
MYNCWHKSARLCCVDDLFTVVCEVGGDAPVDTVAGMFADLAVVTQGALDLTVRTTEEVSADEEVQAGSVIDILREMVGYGRSGAYVVWFVLLDPRAGQRAPRALRSITSKRPGLRSKPEADHGAWPTTVTARATRW